MKLRQWLAEQFTPGKLFDKANSDMKREFGKHEVFVQETSEPIDEKLPRLNKEADELTELIRGKGYENLSKSEQKLVDVRLEALQTEVANNKLKTDRLKTKQNKMDKRFAEYKKYTSKLGSNMARNIIILAGIVLTISIFGGYILIAIYDPEWGNNVKPEYYAVLAQVLPALLIALFLSNNSKKESDVDDEEISIWRRLLHESKFLGIYGFVIAEIACLTAIATGWMGTGIFMVSLAGTFMISLLLMERILKE